MLLTQDVAHILLYCNHPHINGKREALLAKYENYVNTFAEIRFKSSTDKLREMLNLGPSCNADLQERATNTMRAFVIHVYKL